MSLSHNILHFEIVVNILYKRFIFYSVPNKNMYDKRRKTWRM